MIACLEDFVDAILEQCPLEKLLSAVSGLSFRRHSIGVKQCLLTIVTNKLDANVERDCVFEFLYNAIIDDNCALVEQYICLTNQSMMVEQIASSILETDNYKVMTVFSHSSFSLPKEAIMSIERIMTEMHNISMTAMDAKISESNRHQYPGKVHTTHLDHLINTKHAQIAQFHRKLACIKWIDCKTRDPTTVNRSHDVSSTVTPMFSLQNTITAAMVLFDQLRDTAQLTILFDMSNALIKTLYRENKEKLKESFWYDKVIDIKLVMLLKALRNNQVFLAEIWINLGANPTEAIPYIIDDALDDAHVEAESPNVDVSDLQDGMSDFQSALPEYISLQSKMLIFLSQHGGNINRPQYLRKLADAPIELQQSMFYMNIDINTPFDYKYKCNAVTFLVYLMLSGKHSHVVMILRKMIARQRTGWSLERDNLDVLLEINSTLKPFPHIIKYICGYFPPPQHHVLDIEKKRWIYSADIGGWVDEGDIIMYAYDQECLCIVTMLNVYYAGMFV